MNKRKTLRTLLAAVSSAALLATPAAGFAVAKDYFFFTVEESQRQD